MAIIEAMAIAPPLELALTRSALNRVRAGLDLPWDGSRRSALLNGGLGGLVGHLATQRHTWVCIEPDADHAAIANARDDSATFVSRTLLTTADNAFSMSEPVTGPCDYRSAPLAATGLAPASVDNVVVQLGLRGTDDTTAIAATIRTIGRVGAPLVLVVHGPLRVERWRVDDNLNRYQTALYQRHPIDLAPFDEFRIRPYVDKASSMYPYEVDVSAAEGKVNLASLIRLIQESPPAQREARIRGWVGWGPITETIKRFYGARRSTTRVRRLVTVYHGKVMPPSPEPVV